MSNKSEWEKDWCLVIYVHVHHGLHSQNPSSFYFIFTKLIRLCEIVNIQKNAEQLMKLELSKKIKKKT